MTLLLSTFGTNELILTIVVFLSAAGVLKFLFRSWDTKKELDKLRKKTDELKDKQYP